MTPSFRPLGSTGLECTIAGFGAYRINEGNPRHEAALRHYLGRGGNLIDTSANYGDGLSEVLIGRVLRDHDRAKLVVVTKGGYIQGRNMELAHEREFPETVRYANDLWHCIHPHFLETQIELSLKRLALPFVDVYLLHNPEYYLNYIAHTSPISDAVLHEFYRRIKQAFIYLETQVAAGRLRFYGISSNNFGFHEKDRARVSVERCLEIAHGLSPDHHFRVVQLPLNLYEPGGALFQTNRGLSVLQFCREERLAVLVNRPLNAFFRNRLVRLADFRRPGDTGSGEPELDASLQTLRDLERTFQERFGRELFGKDEEGLAAYLRMIALDLRSKDQWNGVMDRFVVPPLTQWLRQAQHEHRDKAGWNGWQQEFVLAVNRSLEGVERFLSASAQPVSDGIRRSLGDCGYPDVPHSLSRIAISLLSRLDGVSCVLVGMRTPEYVDDAMGSEELPPVDARQILDRFHEMTMSAQEGPDEHE